MRWQCRFMQARALTELALGGAQVSGGDAAWGRAWALGLGLGLGTDGRRDGYKAEGGLAGSGKRLSTTGSYAATRRVRPFCARR